MVRLARGGLTVYRLYGLTALPHPFAGDLVSNSTTRGRKSHARTHPHGRRRNVRRPVVGMWHLGLVMTALLACLCLAAVPVEAQRVTVAAVVQVADGNTLTARTKDGAELRIRLLGIDAPEVAQGKRPGQPFGREARDYLDRQITGKGVRLQIYGQDRYGRALAVVWNGTINMNVMMVMMGYAEFYRAAPCEYYCAELLEGEAWARQQRMGVWAQGTSHESPAEFRRRLKISED